MVLPDQRSLKSSSYRKKKKGKFRISSAVLGGDFINKGNHPRQKVQGETFRLQVRPQFHAYCPNLGET